MTSKSKIKEESPFKLGVNEETARREASSAHQHRQANLSRHAELLRQISLNLNDNRSDKKKESIESEDIPTDNTGLKTDGAVPDTKNNRPSDKMTTQLARIPLKSEKS
jgi:hypothetical protein